MIDAGDIAIAIHALLKGQESVPGAVFQDAYIEPYVAWKTSAQFTITPKMSWGSKYRITVEPEPESEGGKASHA